MQRAPKHLEVELALGADVVADQPTVDTRLGADLDHRNRVIRPRGEVARGDGQDRVSPFIDRQSSPARLASGIFRRHARNDRQSVLALDLSACSVVPAACAGLDETAGG